MAGTEGGAGDDTLTGDEADTTTTTTGGECLTEEGGLVTEAGLGLGEEGRARYRTVEEEGGKNKRQI